MATAVKPNLAGPLSFGVGIIIAIAGATKLPADGTKWPDTWPIFLIGALLSVAGIVLWRMAEAKQDAAAASALKASTRVRTSSNAFTSSKRSGSRSLKRA